MNSDASELNYVVRDTIYDLRSEHKDFHTNIELTFEEFQAKNSHTFWIAPCKWY